MKSTEALHSPHTPSKKTVPFIISSEWIVLHVRSMNRIGWASLTCPSCQTGCERMRIVDMRKNQVSQYRFVIDKHGQPDIAPQSSRFDSQVLEAEHPKRSNCFNTAPRDGPLEPPEVVTADPFGADLKLIPPTQDLDPGCGHSTCDQWHEETQDDVVRNSLQEKPADRSDNGQPEDNSEWFLKADSELFGPQRDSQVVLVNECHASKPMLPSGL
jgi:hypothetical protein